MVWWVKVLIMVVNSLIATTLPTPIPIADLSFIATIQAFHNFLWFAIIVLIITTTDTIFAILTYKLGHKLTDIFVRREKTKRKLANIKARLSNKNNDFMWRSYDMVLSGELSYVRLGGINWVDVWVLLASATPFPFTLTIYATSVLGYENKKFVPIIFFGRLIKYTVIAIAFYFGIKIIGG